MKRSCEQRQSVLRRGTKSQRRGTSTGKRVLSVLLTCVMVLGLFPAVPVYAADTAITGSISLVNGGHYSLSTNLTGKTITVPNGVTATVTVPAGKTVTLDNQTAGGSPFSVAR